MVQNEEKKEAGGSRDVRKQRPRWLSILMNIQDGLGIWAVVLEGAELL
jgi:hypothetical protein